MRAFALILPFVVVAAYAQSYSTVYTFAGTSTPGFVDGTLGTSRFNYPYGICYDAVGNAIYVADAFNHRIRKIEDGIVSTLAGSGIPGDADGQGTSASFNTPTGVYFKGGMLYVCDNLSNKIRRVDSFGNVTTIAGSGAWAFQDGAAASAAFKEPKSVVVDDAGVIYVADYENHRIRKIQNGIVTTVAGTGFAGDGTGPALSADLHRPRDLCVATDGTLYFVDLMNHRVKRLTTGGIVEVVAGTGYAGWADGTGTAAVLNTPVGIDWLSPTELLVLDAVNPRFRKVTTSGVVTTLAGSGDTGYLDGPEALSSFDLPQDICKGANGDLYIADRNNNCIRILYKSGNEPMGLSGNKPTATLPAFPNPAIDRITIDLSSVTGKVEAFDVFDQRGVRVMSIAQVAGEQRSALLTLPVDRFASGTYHVGIRSGGANYVSTFIKE